MYVFYVCVVGCLFYTYVYIYCVLNIHSEYELLLCFVVATELRLFVCICITGEWGCGVDWRQMAPQYICIE
jgi:hypothetical protein